MFKRLAGILATSMLLGVSAQAAEYRLDFSVDSFYGSAPFDDATGYAIFSASSPEGEWSEVKDFGLKIGNVEYSMSDVEVRGYPGIGTLIGGAPSGASMLITGTNDFYVVFDGGRPFNFNYTSTSRYESWVGSSYSYSVSSVASPAPVPEPETYAMLLAGLGLMGFVSRRRNT